MQKISDWIKNSDGRPLFLLSGRVGAGKSALAQSTAELCAQEGKLAASFFFSRDHADRSSTSRVFPTIAYQLALSLPSIQGPFEKAMRKHPAILTKSPRDQLRTLIVNSLRSLGKRNVPPMIIVVDALDECRDESSVEEMISLIADVLGKAQVPLQFFFTTRPVPHILEKFQDFNVAAMTCSSALEDFDPHSNVRIFLRHGFTQIYNKRQQLMSNVPQPWPLEEDLERLVVHSSGLFTYASTLLSFIDDKASEGPSERLNAILAVERSENTLEFASLDRLYKQIFSLCSYSDLTRSVVGTIVLLLDPLAPEDVEQLLGLKSGDGWLALQGLHFVFILPSEHGKPVRIFHASLHDFLTDITRSGKYFIDPPVCHAALARACLALMTAALKRDVGNIEDPLTLHGDTRKLACGRECVSGALGYACRYWAAHLAHAPLDSGLLDDLRRFAFKSTLYWIEALSLIGNLEKAVPSMQSAKAWLEVGDPRFAS